MVAPHKVIYQLNHSLYIFGVIFLQQKQKLCLNRGLVIVFLLVLDHLDSHLSLCLVVIAFDHASKSAFAYLSNNLVAVPDLITRRESVVTFLVVKAIIN